MFDGCENIGTTTMREHATSGDQDTLTRASVFSTLIRPFNTLTSSPISRKKKIEIGDDVSVLNVLVRVEKNEARVYRLCPTEAVLTRRGTQLLAAVEAWRVG